MSRILAPASSDVVRALLALVTDTHFPLDTAEQLLGCAKVEDRVPERIVAFAARKQMTVVKAAPELTITFAKGDVSVEIGQQNVAFTAPHGAEIWDVVLTEHCVVKAGALLFSDNGDAATPKPVGLILSTVRGSQRPASAAAS